MLAGTPAQDYDDSYCISYAKENNAYIVTNDKYRDYLEKATDKKKEREWLKLCLVTFTFEGDNFLVNPDCDFSKRYRKA